MFSHRSSGLTVDEYLRAYSDKIGEQLEIVSGVFYGELRPTFKILQDMRLKSKYESLSEENPIKNKYVERGFSCVERIEFSRTLYVSDYSA